MSDARYVNLEPARLARAVERLRFQLAHGLGGDERRLEVWTRRLLTKAPDHVISLNLLAWRALPETALPRPPAALAPSAPAFLAGRLAADEREWAKTNGSKPRRRDERRRRERGRERGRGRATHLMLITSRHLTTRGLHTCNPLS